MNYEYICEVTSWEAVVQKLKEKLADKQPIYSFAQTSLDEFCTKRYVSLPLATFPIDIIVGVAIANGKAQFPDMDRIHIFLHTFPVKGLGTELTVFVCVACTSDESFDPVTFAAK